jgi:hypothetical protein
MEISVEMKIQDHKSHKWRYSDSSYYDFVCENCNVAEETTKAKEPCADRYKDAIQHINHKKDVA